MLARTTLLVFTLLNFANYVDRYVLPPVLESLKRDPAFLGVSDYQLGKLQTAFFLAYMVLSPIAGVAGRRVPRRYLVALGVGLWSAATVLSGLARSYDELFAARALIGAGEGGYATLAPAILSDLFAPGRRSRVLALFYVATPVGSALGMMLGGFFAQHYSWRAAFFVAGAPGLLLALIVLLLPEPRRGAMDGAASPAGNGDGALAAALPVTRVVDELKALWGNRTWLRVTLSNTLIAFSIGGLAYWMPSYFQAARGLDAQQASLVVGASAVVGGLLGTLAGGFLGDAWLKRDPAALLRVSGLGILVGAPIVLLLPLAPSTVTCVALFLLANFFLFFNTGPLNTALVESAPASFREGAVGLHIFLIHLLGDAISPSLMGALIGVLAGARVAASSASLTTSSAATTSTESMARGQALGAVIALCVVPLAACAASLLVGLPARTPRPSK